MFRQCNGSLLELDHGRFASIEGSAKPAPSELRTMPFESLGARGMALHQVFVDLVTDKRDLLSSFPMVKIERNIGKLIGQIERFVSLTNFISKMDIEP